MLLPAPLGPIRPTISPEASVNVRSLTATRPPNPCAPRARRAAPRSPPAASRRASGGAAATGLRRCARQQAFRPGPQPVARALQQGDDQHAEHHDLEVAGRAEQHRQRILQVLLEERDDRRADHRAEHAARAADDRHEQVFDALVDAERRGIDEALQVRVQPARDAGQQRGVDEDDDLEPRAVDAERLGHVEPCLERADRAARTRVEQVAHRPQRREHDDPDQPAHSPLVLELDAGKRQRRDAGEAGVTAEEIEVAEQEEEADPPRDRRQRQEVAAHPQRDEAERQRDARTSARGRRRARATATRHVQWSAMRWCTRRARRRPPGRTTSARRRR